MQGDAMKEQSDANAAVFVWGVIMRLCMHVFLFFVCVCCHPCHTDLVTSYLWMANLCIIVSCGVHIHDSEVCSCLRVCRLTLCFCVCVRVREVKRAACRSAVNPAHLLICSLAWQRSSPAKAVSHKNQPLSQHITAAGISNGTGNRGNHSQCPQHSHTHTQTNQELLLICTQGVFLCLSPSLSPLLFLSTYPHSFLPSPLAWLPTYSKAYSLVINLPLSPLLLRLSLHHHLTLARLPVLTPPSPPFACPFSEALSPTSSISVSLPYALCRHNARRHQNFSFLIHPSSPSWGFKFLALQLFNPPWTIPSFFAITCAGCLMWFV